jgi:regulator of RNase E activity RraA
MNTEQYFALPEPIPQDILERFRKLSPAQLCDGMQSLGIARNGCMDSDLMPLDESKIMLGTAYTVDTEDGDNFPIHVAIYQGRPGYVLVVAGKGYRGRAYIGDLMAGAAQAVGLSGLVIDGCVRDKVPLAELDIPVYAKGFMQRSPAKQGPGKINAPVHSAGIEVTWSSAITTVSLSFLVDACSKSCRLRRKRMLMRPSGARSSMITPVVGLTVSRCQSSRRPG